MNELADALARSETRQREFLLSVSHELRTPLTAVRGFAESLADGVVVGADVPAAGAVILREAQRLDRLEARGLVKRSPSETDGRGVLVKVLRVGVDGTDREINAAEYGAAPQGYDFLIVGGGQAGIPLAQHLATRPPSPRQDPARGFPRA